MTHVYSAGGSRRAAVFTGIVSLHVAVMLAVLNNQIPAFRAAPPDSGPIEVLPPKPVPPVVAHPGKVVLVEPYGPRVERPDLSIPDFTPANEVPDAVPGDESGEGQLLSAGEAVVRTRASLRGQGRNFAAVVRACYPAGARRDSEEGLLKLAVSIGAGGQVIAWRVADSTGFSRLDAAAQCVLDKLRFNAAREDGRAVQSEVILPIVFRLD